MPACVGVNEPAFQRVFFLLRNGWCDDIPDLAPQNCSLLIVQVDWESLCSVQKSSQLHCPKQTDGFTCKVLSHAKFMLWIEKECV